MKKAIYYRLISFMLVLILIYSLIFAVIGAINTQNEVKGWLTDLTLSTAELYRYHSDINLLSRAAGNSRVTIISPDGRVLADSEIDAILMQDRADREEVRYATQHEVYIAIRTSHTFGQQFMYAAILMADGNILRLAHSYAGFVHNLIVQLPAMLATIFVAFILALFLARKFSKTITNPLEIIMNALSAHEYTHLRAYQSPYQEVDNIMQSIETLLQEISVSRQSLLLEQGKINHILSNMAEGFVLIDKDSNILLCNHSAKKFFDGKDDVFGQNITTLVNDKSINVAITKALEKEQSSIFEMWLHTNLILNVYVSPAGESTSQENESGVTILFVDVTNEKRLEKQKRDFFSNASHELKTPITSILGFSEMINQNIVQTEAEKETILKRIETEARRMSELINNLLMVSKLESKNTFLEYTDFNLYQVLQEAVDSVSPINHNTTIQIQLNATDINVHANKGQLYEMCVNLIENAVKYNKPNGVVSIELREKKNLAILKVKDTGIGIPFEYHTRVFERFFRVDYGRDKKVGGSGLGLSIVKHIVNMYNGEIVLRSKKNMGTTIQISLPIVRK